MRVGGAVSLAAAASASALLHLVVRDLDPVVHLVVAVVIWLVLLAGLYSEAGKGPEQALGWAGGTVVVALAAAAIEFFATLLLIFVSPLYALLAVLVPVFATKRFVRWHRARS